MLTVLYCHVLVLCFTKGYKMFNVYIFCIYWMINVNVAIHLFLLSRIVLNSNWFFCFQYVRKIIRIRIGSLNILILLYKKSFVAKSYAGHCLFNWGTKSSARHSSLLLTSWRGNEIGVSFSIAFLFKSYLSKIFFFFLWIFSFKVLLNKISGMQNQGWECARSPSKIE